MKEEISDPQQGNEQNSPNAESDSTENQSVKTAEKTIEESEGAKAISSEVSTDSDDSEEKFLESRPESPDDSSDDDHEGDDHDQQEDYSTMDQEQLVKLLEEYVDEVEVPRFKSKIASIKDLLQDSFEQEKNNLLTAFLEEGGNKDDFKPSTNPLENRFADAIRKFNKKRAEYHHKIEQERQSNLEGKRGLLEQLKELIQNEDNMKKAFDRFHELQATWRGLGPVPATEVRDLHLSYKALVDRFYDYIKINRELQELDQRRNLEMKIALCEQAEALMMENSINTALKELHTIQDKWRETGPVPRENKDEIWDRFKSASDKIYDKRRDYIAQSAEKRQQNLEAKQALVEQVDKIETSESLKHKEWQELTAKISSIQQDWRKIGRAEKKLNDEVWERFKKSCDRFYKAKHDFYQKRKQEFASNLQLKTELCIQAEALQNNSDWKATTAELIRLQEEWKKIGHVGERQSDKIWKRFRKACDMFFKNKSDHFADRDKEFEENYKKKVELISRIESFDPGEDHSAAFEDLKEIQRAWSEMGMVPLSKKDEINKKYKSAIDAQFDKLKISSAERHKLKYQNKIEHIKNSNDPRKMDAERRFLLSKISELKSEVQTWENNIGFFAKSKNADKLKEEFEQKIEKARQEIGQLQEKLNMARS